MLYNYSLKCLSPLISYKCVRMFCQHSKTRWLMGMVYAVLLLTILSIWQSASSGQWGFGVEMVFLPPRVWGYPRYNGCNLRYNIQLLQVQTLSQCIIMTPWNIKAMKMCDGTLMSGNNWQPFTYFGKCVKIVLLSKVVQAS